MARVVYLDSGPLGLVAMPPGKPPADECRAWLRALVAAGATVIVPDIADYEVRRELLRLGLDDAVRRLDELRAALRAEPIDSAAMTTAAALWAGVRRRGKPTASPDALDGDAILAGQVLTAGGEGAVIATTNVGHLARFPGIDARGWAAIT